MERKKSSDFPQELLDIFDRYVHGDIDRREFISRAGKFAVGGLTAVGLFEALSPNYAWAKQVPTDDKRIKTGYETVPSPDGNGSIKGYLVRPAGGGRQPARCSRAVDGIQPTARGVDELRVAPNEGSDQRIRSAPLRGVEK